jgi:hypothetical protein
MAKTRTANDLDFKLADENDIWRGYDPGKAAAALKRLAGAWSHLDTDKMSKDIVRWRQEGTRP